MRITLTLLLAAALTACGTTKKDLSAPLAYVPADTPYVFANLEPLPADVTDAYTDMLKPAQDAFQKLLADLRTEAGQSMGDPEEKRKMLGLIGLIEDKLTVEGWEKIGFSRTARAAIYGVGVMPVVRIELADEGKLRAFIAELESLAGKPLPTAEIEGRTYWRMAPDDNKSVAFVMAIIDQHLVLTADVDAEIAALPELLGLRQPARSLLDSGELVELNREFGYTPYGTFLLDSRRLVAALFGRDGADTWLTRSMAKEGKPLSAACRSEFAAMADTIPRLLGGYTRLDRTGIDSHSLIELKPAIAQAFKGMVAPVPGLGSHDGKVPLDFGFGLKLDKLAEFIQAQAMAITSAPYACDMLADLNRGAAEVSQQVAGLYMAAGWFSGARVVLERLDWAGLTPRPDTAEGSLVIASPSPLGLIGMLKGFVPQLADLDLQPGAAPLALPLGDMAGADVPPSWIALNDAAIGIGVGPSAVGKLPGYLSAPSPSRPPLLHFSYQGAFYGGLMRKYQEITDVATQSALDSIWDGVDDEATSDEDKARKLEQQRSRVQAQQTQRYTQDFIAAFYAVYDAIDFTSVSLIPGDRGLDMQQVMRFRR